MDQLSFLMEPQKQEELLVNIRYKGYTIGFKCDTNGRIVVVEFQEDDVKFMICCIYAPNKDESCFWKQIFDMTCEFSEHKVIIGDFNMVLDARIDRLNSVERKMKAVNDVHQMMEEMHLGDVWHIKNPDAKRYSWFRRKQASIIASRLDFGLISLGLVDQCKNTFYSTGLMMDHSAFYVIFQFNMYSRGVGY